MHLVTDVVAFEPMPAKGVQGIGLLTIACAV